MNTPVYLGIDIGGSSVKAGLVDDHGEIWARTMAKLHFEEGLEATLDTIADAADRLLKHKSLDAVDAIGVAAPGTMDIAAGVVFHPFNLPGWKDLPLRDLIAERLGRPTVLQNDANAAALGEYWIGAGRDANSLAFWTLGTGIGGGIVVNGQLIEGAHSHAGECGHMVLQMDGGPRSEFGMHGSLECYAGARALVRRCHEALKAKRESRLRGMDPEAISPRAIADAAEAGDALADELIMESARCLGVATASLMSILNPEMVLIGGAMTFGGRAARTGIRFLQRVRAEVKERAFPIPAARTVIDYASLGNKAGFVGAACYAKQKLGPAAAAEVAPAPSQPFSKSRTPVRAHV